MTYPELASRTSQILPFHAMSIFKRSSELERQGRDIISLGIGEPDFTASPDVLQALKNAADAGLSRYSPAIGIAPLRETIAKHYAEQFGCEIDPECVIVTSGASGALLLANMALVNPGAEVLMPDPCYPPNINFVTAAGGTTKLIPTSAEHRYQPTLDQVKSNWSATTAGILLASPGNPTGTLIEHQTLSSIIDYVHAKQGFVMMDEIYLGLSYQEKRRSALELNQNVIVLGSFSKYFHMTGWRLGWMIVPPHMVTAIENLASSLAICPPTLAQHAALSCFTESSLAIFEQRREAFRQRRDFFVPALESIGLSVPAHPEGAFYVYADITRFSNDSDELAKQILERGGVAVVPGKDFGPTHAKSMIRLSYTIGLDRLQQAVERIEKVLKDIG